MKRFTRAPHFPEWPLLIFTLLAITACGPVVIEINPGAPVAQAAAGLGVGLRAASGATIPFVTQNGKTVRDVLPQTLEIPHLVLLRNGALSDADERTLILEVSGLEVPPTGVTVTLDIETQHGDPDAGDHFDQRIAVWQASQWFANSTGITQTGVTATFVHTFAAVTNSGAGTIATPTDYFRLEVTVTAANTSSAEPLTTFSQDDAFLIENQWIARLPALSEEREGAAPDELVITYCDMFPFRQRFHEPATWVPRNEITRYVETELVPRMVEAVRTQSEVWGFSWYEAWTSYRSEAPEKLSVTLSDGQTWFHGAAPSGGHSGISIKVSGRNNASFATLGDGILSTFHHELFHNLQRNISLHHGGDGRADGAQDAWQFFSEGTAVLAESVAQPGGQFSQTLPARTYMSYANSFVWRNSERTQGLNLHYGDMDPYQAAIYWRFLYERCAGNAQDPAVGMQVIRRALKALYAGEVVDIRASTGLVSALPELMDRALTGSSCPFQTYRESLTAFAGALYALRLDGGICIVPGTPDGCGFYDPYDQYKEPPINTIAYAGTEQTYEDGIGSSFGIDLIEVHLDPAVDGQPLTLEFHRDAATGAVFDVQIWLLTALAEGAKPRRVTADAADTEGRMGVSSDGHLSYTIPAIRTTTCNRLGLIVTRLDSKEAADPFGGYTILLHPGLSQP